MKEERLSRLIEILTSDALPNSKESKIEIINYIESEVIIWVAQKRKVERVENKNKGGRK